MNLTKKMVFGIFTLAFGTSSLVFASVAQNARIISDKLLQVENRMNPVDRDKVAQLSLRIDVLANKYAVGQPIPMPNPLPFPLPGLIPQNFGSQVICISNGDTGSFEKFRPILLSNNTALGGWTQKQTCEVLVSTATWNLMCLSDGDTGNFEKFVIYDKQNQQTLGGKTSFETCKTLISRSNPQLVCVSNGDNGSFEKFTLINLFNQQSIGGQTSLQNCIQSIK
jgi:hypothetical protein